MKKRVALLLSGLFVWVVLLCGQNVPEGVIGAFKKGNSQELGRYLGDKVDLTIRNKQASMSRKAAEESMASFFSGHRVSEFEVNHQGKRNESGFFVGTLTTSDGNFRVNCFFRKMQNRYIVYQIRIDKTNE